MNKEKKKILYICGSINQTTMMHRISEHLPEYDNYFSAYYGDGLVDLLATAGYLDFTILGKDLTERAFNYLRDQGLKIDHKGQKNDYDLVLTCSDLIIPKNIRNKRIVLVQEGMTDPKNIAYFLVKWMKLPRYLASTSTTGMSGAFDLFCVASEGYKEHFVQNGVSPEKIEITGIPNFDNCVQYYDNTFPHKNFVLVATSDSRETFKFENRKKFILQAVEIAKGKKLIFKLHPNENFERATKEINKWAPGALVYTSGDAHEMIANCDTLIAKYSTLVYTGIALGKEVYSYFDLDVLQKLSPIQNGGESAKNIAQACRRLIVGGNAKGNPSAKKRRAGLKAFKMKVLNGNSRKEKKAGKKIKNSIDL